MNAQGLDERAPFGNGPKATLKAVEQLGYIQIDTINVIERCHHHILFTRIPDYNRAHLQKAQSTDKSVFEYWTHALSYVPTNDYRYYMGEMKRIKTSPGPWLRSVKREELQKVLRLVRNEGPLSIRDIKDDVLVDKSHLWGSRKPSKKALQLGFYQGDLVISERQGMLKKYELALRHFSWKKKPKAATEKETLSYLLDRALRSQTLISLDSVCYLNAKNKSKIRNQIESRVKKSELVSVEIEDLEKMQFWAKPEKLDLILSQEQELVHILSPFDPLVIQRKRLQAFFEYEHRFEAYLPKHKRVFGYFALPVLVGDEVSAVLDLKLDRENRRLMMQKWTWLENHKSHFKKKLIEEELHRFEKFQIES